MYLDIVVIDTLAANGIMTSFNIKPNSSNERVIINRYRDIHPDRFGNEFDLGGTRIYNFDECSIIRSTTRPRSFEVKNNKFSFKFEYFGIPIGPSRMGCGGIYNLILAPGLRLVDFRIVDPYDHKNEDICEKKEFRYNILWDTENKIQLIEMDLRSNRGSFSFIVSGSFVFVDLPGEYSFIEAKEYDWKISDLTNYDMLKDEGKKELGSEILKTLNKYVEIKLPIVPGAVSINGNEILSSKQESLKK